MLWLVTWIWPLEWYAVTVGGTLPNGFPVQSPTCMSSFDSDFWPLAVYIVLSSEAIRVNMAEKFPPLCLFSVWVFFCPRGIFKRTSYNWFGFNFNVLTLCIQKLTSTHKSYDSIFKSFLCNNTNNCIYYFTNIWLIQD